jgi:hypothetical protein
MEEADYVFIISGKTGILPISVAVRGAKRPGVRDRGVRRNKLQAKSFNLLRITELVGA